MKKDIEWLKEEVKKLEDKADKRNQFGSEYTDEEVALENVKKLINQLNEPEITLNEAFNKLEETHILSKEEIAKHFEQLEIHNGKVTYGDYETLSQEWIDDNSVYASSDGVTEEYVHVDDLQNLLVPKQEEVDRAYKDGYEKGKQHTFYKGYLEGLGDKGSEPETVADVVTTFWESYERLKEVMSMEVEELEE